VRFMDKRQRTEYSIGYRLGDLVFEVLAVVGKKNLLPRLLWFRRFTETS